MLILQNKWINRLIPFPGFRACNLLGVLFVRGERKLSDATLNHERIHSAQIAEVMLASAPLAALLWIFSSVWVAILLVLASYYLWYLIEWAIHFTRIKDAHLAYRMICFEREAYENQNDLNYLESRSWFKFIQFL